MILLFLIPAWLIASLLIVLFMWAASPRRRG